MTVKVDTVIVNLSMVTEVITRLGGVRRKTVRILLTLHEVLGIRFRKN